MPIRITEHTAHEIASTPELYDKIYSRKGHGWECMGYARTGKTIRFARIVQTNHPGIFSKNWSLKQITIWVKPETLFESVEIVSNPNARRI